MFQQCFQILVHTADNREDHCLPRHVRFLLDEFPNIGMIPDFQILISTIRSRNIGCTLIYQSIAQLKSQYGDDWGTILENCDSELVLGGGNNPESLEFFGKQLGKRTIEVLNTTENLGAQGSFSKNYQVASRDLMTPEEIRTMPRNRCLLMISGVVPFYSYKFDLKKHPNYALVEKEGHRPFDYERRAENNFAAFMKNVQEITTSNSTMTSLTHKQKEGKLHGNGIYNHFSYHKCRQFCRWPVAAVWCGDTGHEPEGPQRSRHQQRCLVDCWRRADHCRCHLLWHTDGQLIGGMHYF